MKIKKSQLLQIVKEQFDMDEMAAHEHPKSRPLVYNDKTYGHRFKSGSKEDILNKENLPLPAYIVVYTCGDEVQHFIETHQELLEKIKEEYMNPETSKYKDLDVQYPEIIFTNAKECPAANPYQGPEKHYFDKNGNEIQTGIPSLSYKKDVKSGKHHSLQEAINRNLKAYLFGKTNKTGEITVSGLMNDEDLNEHLQDCSIPMFRIRGREYEDNYDKRNTNSRIHYASISFILYKSFNDFLGEVVKRNLGILDGSKKVETHVARQFNTLYRNWDKNKKTDKKYEGRTNIYKLQKRGYEEENFDVNVFSKFDLLGTLNDNDTFTWRIKLEVFYGKKLPGKNIVESRNVKLFKNINATKIVEIDPNKNYIKGVDKYMVEVPPGDDILSDANVVNGLIEVISEFKDEIMSINPDDAVEMANYFQYEVGEEPVEEPMAEAFNKMIKSVLKEHGMKKTIRVKESDLIRIIAEGVVKGLYEQEQFDDFITKTKQNNEEMRNEQDVEPDNQEEPETGGEQIELTIGKDENGNFYIIKDADTDHAKIVTKTR